MHRVRWFEVDWNSKYNTVIDAILADQYNEEKDYGFKAYKRRDGLLHASYIYKHMIEEKVENPLTHESTIYQKVLYEQTDFVLINNQFGIELINPTKSVQRLLNIFASKANFNIIIKPLNLDLAKLLQILKTEFDSFVIHQIECKDIYIKQNTLMKLSAINKRSDVSCDVEEFLKDKHYTIDKIKCNFVLGSLSSSFELTDTGSLKTNKNNFEVLLPIIKNAISKNYNIYTSR